MKRNQYNKIFQIYIMFFIFVILSLLVSIFSKTESYIKSKNFCNSYIIIKINGKGYHRIISSEYTGFQDWVGININSVTYQYDPTNGFPYEIFLDWDSDNSIELEISYMIYDYSKMFSGCSNITEIDLSSIEGENANNFSNMFENCFSLTSIIFPYSEITTATDMSFMFSNCYQLSSLNLIYFKTISVTNMEYMFSGCKSLKYLTLSSFSLSQVINIAGMFSNCESLEVIPLSNLGSSSIQNMSNLFYGCSSVKSLYLVNFDTRNVISFEKMFMNCISLLSLNIPNFDTSNIQSMNKMFYNCTSLESLNLSNFNTIQVQDMTDMFSFCKNLTYIDLKNFEETNLQYFTGIFDNTPVKMTFCLNETKNPRIFAQITNTKPNSTIKCPYNLVSFPPTTIISTINDIPKISTINIIPKISTIPLIPTPSIISALSSIPEIISTTETLESMTNPEILITSQRAKYTEYNIEMSTIQEETNEILNNYSFSTNFFKNFENIQDNDEIYDIILEYILPNFSPENKMYQIIEGKNSLIYQLSNYRIQLELIKNKSIDNNNLSHIDLDLCEKLLKDEYNIDDKDDLIILIYEKRSNIRPLEKNVKLEIFEPYNKTKLNSSICHNTSIKLYVKMELGENVKKLSEQIKEYGYDMFNINDPFYQDICTPYKTQNSTDILLIDRIDYIYNNEDTKCQGNCQFSEYNLETKYMSCKCNIDTNITENKNDKFPAKKLYESFYDVLKYSNYKIFKCYKLVFNKKLILKNVGGMIIIFYYLIHIVCFIIFLVLKENPLKKELINLDKDNFNKDVSYNMTINQIKYAKKKSKIFYPPKVKKSYHSTLIIILTITLDLKVKKIYLQEILT